MASLLPSCVLCLIVLSLMACVNALLGLGDFYKKHQCFVARAGAGCYNHGTFGSLEGGQSGLAELAQKLGIKPGYLVCLLDAPEEAQGALAQAVPPGASISESLNGGGYDLILFWPRDLVGLAERFSQLQHAIRPDGAIWAVIPKKQYARRRGVSFTWEEMQAAGLATDLVDNKVASITPEDYGTRFVIRKERRRDYG